METIKGKCFTNLDDYDVSLVKEFTRTPNVGERVTVRRKGDLTSLKIVQITHSVKDNEPFIIVELHTH